MKEPGGQLRPSNWFAANRRFRTAKSLYLPVAAEDEIALLVCEGEELAGDVVGGERVDGGVADGGLVAEEGGEGVVPALLGGDGGPEEVVVAEGDGGKVLGGDGADLALVDGGLFLEATDGVHEEDGEVSDGGEDDDEPGELPRQRPLGVEDEADPVHRRVLTELVQLLQPAERRRHRHLNLIWGETWRVRVSTPPVSTYGDFEIGREREREWKPKEMEPTFQLCPVRSF